MFIVSKKYFKNLFQILDFSLFGIIKVVFLILCVGCLDFLSLSQLQTIIDVNYESEGEHFSSENTLFLMLGFFLLININFIRYLILISKYFI